jgi:hypothetical protein
MGGGFTSGGLAVPGSRGNGGHPVEDRVSTPPIWRKADVHVDQQLSEETRAGTADEGHGFERAGPTETTHPPAFVDCPPRTLPPAARSRIPDHHPVTPPYAVPGLVLLAASAIYTEYHWLHLFPDGSFRPIALFFALGAAPATWALTRHVDAPQVPRAKTLARAGAGIEFLLALIVAANHDSPLSRVLGVASLGLAVSLVTLAFGSERRRPPPTDNG